MFYIFPIQLWIFIDIYMQISLIFQRINVISMLKNTPLLHS